MRPVGNKSVYLVPVPPMIMYSWIQRDFSTKVSLFTTTVGYPDNKYLRIVNAMKTLQTTKCFFLFGQLQTKQTKYLQINKLGNNT